MAVLAIDIGGTKLAAGIVDTEGRILARGEVPTLAAEGLEPVLGRIVGLGRDLLSRPEVADVPSIESAWAARDRWTSRRDSSSIRRTCPDGPASP